MGHFTRKKGKTVKSKTIPISTNQTPQSSNKTIALIRTNQFKTKDHQPTKTKSLHSQKYIHKKISYLRKKSLKVSQWKQIKSIRIVSTYLKMWKAWFSFQVKIKKSKSRAFKSLRILNRINWFNSKWIMIQTFSILKIKMISKMMLMIKSKLRLSRKNWKKLLIIRSFINWLKDLLIGKLETKVLISKIFWKKVRSMTVFKMSNLWMILLKLFFYKKGKKTKAWKENISQMETHIWMKSKINWKASTELYKKMDYTIKKSLTQSLAIWENQLITPL